LRPASGKVHGFDFFHNQDIRLAPIPLNNHGTMVTGIIGANRNNREGVAGIAGGNGINTGVSLFAMNCTGDHSVATNTIYRAIVESASALPSNPNYGYKLHVTNHSWSDDVASKVVLGEAAKYSFQNGVVFVAARANMRATYTSLTEERYPACLYKHWVISVSGLDSTGRNIAPFSLRDREVDICAAAEDILSTDLFDVYDRGDGTSFAAPQVAGTAALLLSYYNQPRRTDPNNLTHEDVESILKLSTDTDSIRGMVRGRYDTLYGYGKLNAGKALELVRKPLRKVLHFNQNYPKTITSRLLRAGSNLRLEEAYTDMNGTVTPVGNYTANIHEVITTIQHRDYLDSFTCLLAGWPLGSRTNLLDSLNIPLGRPAAHRDTLYPYENIRLNSYTGTNATLRGYVYELRNAATGALVSWIPYNINTVNANLTAGYSLLAQNARLDAQCVMGHALPSSEIAKSELNVSVYPNPTENVLNIAFDYPLIADLKIDLYDLHGRKMQEGVLGKTSGSRNTFQISVQNWADGLYFYRIQIATQTLSGKFLKF
jgi:hypothetical protein